VGVAEVLECQLATHCVDGILEGGVVLGEAALEGASAEVELLRERSRVEAARVRTLRPPPKEGVTPKKAVRGAKSGGAG